MVKAFVKTVSSLAPTLAVLLARSGRGLGTPYGSEMSGPAGNACAAAGSITGASFEANPLREAFFGETHRHPEYIGEMYSTMVEGAPGKTGSF